MAARPHPLLGQRVTVYLDNDLPATLTGILLAVHDDGEVAVEDELGQVVYGWPALSIRPAGQPPAWVRDTEAEDSWPGGGLPPRRVVTIYLPGDWPDADESPESVP